MAIVLSSGLKGGIGKTTNFRMMIEALRASGMNIAVFDGDRANADTFRYLCEKDEKGQPIENQKPTTGVVRSSVKTKDDIKKLVDLVGETLQNDNTIQHVVIDLPAGGEGSYIELLQKYPQFERALRLIGKDKIILIFSMGDTTNSCIQLDLTLNNLIGKVKFVVVRSEHFPEPFYDQTNFNDRLKKIGGIEITTPEWPRDLMQHLDINNGRFEAITHLGCGLTLSSVAEAQDCWERTQEAWQPVINYLKEEE